MGNGCTDLLKIVGVIIEIKEGLHKVETKYGTLKYMNRRNEFLICNEQLIRIEDGNPTVISVGKASISKESQGFVEYSCSPTRTRCGMKKCKCRSNSM